MSTVAGGVWGSSEDLAWNLGTELHYVLRQSGAVRVLIGPSIAFYSDGSDEDVDFNAAFGVGFEYLWAERVSMKMDLGFTYLGDEEEVYPLPQIALFYYF